MPTHNADMARLFEEMADLLEIGDANPFRVRAYRNAARTVGELQLDIAATLNRGESLPKLPGIGEKTETHILEATEARLSKARRFKLAVGAQYAAAIVAYLRAVPGVRDCLAAGSVRRMRETVGDIDILVTATAGSPVAERFVAYPEVRDVLASGATRSSVVLQSGLQVDLRVVPPDSYGAALQYFTGSKAHSIALRRLAQERGLKLNEYGVFRGATRIAGDTEASVYAALGLPWIPPELREDRGEIDAALQGRLPRLVELADLRGDLHAHTKWTDGHDTVRAMAKAALAHGLSYLAITDHSRRLTFAHGLDPDRLRAQGAEIRKAGAGLEGITLLTGIEVDILDDGMLDLPDRVLAELDVVIAAVHSKFALTRERQTERILRALDNPNVALLAHPLGRLIGEREPYDVDMLKIIRKARARGVFLELNAHPERLDLFDTHCRMARDEGVLVSVNSDAHGVLDFDNLTYGIGQARRGWLEKADVLNTRGLVEVRRLLQKMGSGPFIR